VNEFDRYKAGPSQDTLRALLKAQGDAVYNVCFQVLREGAQAEDAAQQVLLALVKQLPRLSDAAHLKAWVSRAAFHAALDLKKKARRRAEHERRIAEMHQAPALTSDQVEAVHAEIARLDDDLQRVVVEHYFEKRPLRDLAAEQAVSEVAIWKRLQKAKERLRASLASTGFAAALLGLDALLEALEPVRAPEGLVGEGLMTRASSGAAGGLVLAGGIAMNMKLVAGAGLIALLLLAGFGIGVARQRTREAASASRPTNYHYDSSATKAAPEAGASPAAPPAPVAEEVLEFTSFMAFYQAMMKASVTVDLKERTRAFCRLGFRITEAEMAAASQGCPFRPGTEEFSKHLLFALEKLNRSDPARTLAMYRRCTDLNDETRKQITRKLFDGWMKRDPSAARTAAEGLAESEGRTEILSRMAEPERTPEGLARLAVLPEGPERTRAVNDAVEALVRIDLETALRAVESLAPLIRAEARFALAREWAKKDLESALAWVGRTTDRMTRDTLLLYAVGGAAEINPSAAGEAVLKLQDFKYGSNMLTLSIVVAALARTDPAAAAKFLDRVPPFAGKSGIGAQELAPRWGAVDPVEALVWAQQQPAAEQGRLVNAVLKGWVKSPKGSLAEARDMTRLLTEELRPKALEAVVLAWSEIEPPAAATFALAESPEVLAQVVAGWLKRDDAAAVDWVKGLADVAVRDRALYGIVQGYLQVNPNKALGVAESIQAPALRDKVLGELGSSVAETSGVDAGLEIVRKVGDPDARDRAIARMIQRLARQDPRKAAGLADLMSDPAQRTEAIGSILTWGSAADPTLCRELLGKLPRVDSIQYQRVADGFAKKDPAAAAAWALTLPEKQMDPQPGDPSKEYEARPRASALNSVINTWSASDPDAATRWIKESRLEEKERSSLLGVVQFQRRQRK
jgi:RNA polymerase sigma factor (sigma-70 family)